MTAWRSNQEQDSSTASIFGGPTDINVSLTSFMIAWLAQHTGDYTVLTSVLMLRLVAYWSGHPSCVSAINKTILDFQTVCGPTFKCAVKKKKSLIRSDPKICYSSFSFLFCLRCSSGFSVIHWPNIYFVFQTFFLFLFTIIVSCSSNKVYAEANDSLDSGSVLV